MVKVRIKIAVTEIYEKEIEAESLKKAKELAEQITADTNTSPFYTIEQDINSNPHELKGVDDEVKLLSLTVF